MDAEIGKFLMIVEVTGAEVVCGQYNTDASVVIPFEKRCCLCTLLLDDSIHSHFIITSHLWWDKIMRLCGTEQFK